MSSPIISLDMANQNFQILSVLLYFLSWFSSVQNFVNVVCKGRARQMLDKCFFVIICLFPEVIV